MELTFFEFLTACKSVVIFGEGQCRFMLNLTIYQCFGAVFGIDLDLDFQIQPFRTRVMYEGSLPIASAKAVLFLIGTSLLKSRIICA